MRTSSGPARLQGSTEPNRSDRDQFDEQGYIGPVRVLSKQECRRLVQAVKRARDAGPLDWEKGYAARSRTFYELSTHPAINGILAKLLGKDIMLWGASILTRRPGAVHPWHSDIESSAPSSRTVSVWIGMENTSRDSSLTIVPYSHRFNETIQEVRHHARRGRDEATNDDILGWARERDDRAELLSLEMTDGDALFFDGKLWHGSHNLFGKTRHALLLQYAPPDDAIRIPDLDYLDWPFKLLETPRPPCLLLQGTDTSGANRIVTAPVSATAKGRRRLNSRTYPLRIPLPPPKDERWQPHPIFSGSTADVEILSCHASTLGHGVTPHPPHTHKEEELLLLLAGEVDVILPDDPDSAAQGGRHLTPGDFVYYPTGFAHTLRTVTREPANYVMFKWHAASAGTESPLPFGHFRAFENGGEVEDGFRARLIFEGPTAYLQKLHCHASTLTPGAGYEPHVDAYDVAIIMLEGEVETLGERAGSHDVIFYRAGEPHGIRNPGDVPARYLVFEFHGSQTGLREPTGRLPYRMTALLRGVHRRLIKLRSPAAWKGKARQLAKRFKGRVTRQRRIDR